MFLSGIVGTVLWIWSRRWFNNYKYPYRLLVRILIQLSIVGLISILSTTVISPPQSYGEVSTFLPLSYPLLLHWGISGFLVWPPNFYYTISVFGLEFTGGGMDLRSPTSLAEFRVEMFLHSINLFLLFNVVFTGVLLLLSELWKFCKTRIINSKR